LLLAKISTRIGKAQDPRNSNSLRKDKINMGNVSLATLSAHEIMGPFTHTILPCTNLSVKEFKVIKFQHFTRKTKRKNPN